MGFEDPAVGLTGQNANQRNGEITELVNFLGSL
jgi:hypothetical protein